MKVVFVGNNQNIHHLTDTCQAIEYQVFGILYQDYWDSFTDFYVDRDEVAFLQQSIIECLTTNS